MSPQEMQQKVEEAKKNDRIEVDFDHENNRVTITEKDENGEVIRKETYFYYKGQYRLKSFEFQGTDSAGREGMQRINYKWTKRGLRSVQNGGFQADDADSNVELLRRARIPGALTANDRAALQHLMENDPEAFARAYYLTETPEERDARIAEIIAAAETLPGLASTNPTPTMLLLAMTGADPANEYLDRVGKLTWGKSLGPSGVRDVSDLAAVPGAIAAMSLSVGEVAVHIGLDVALSKVPLDDVIRVVPKASTGIASLVGRLVKGRKVAIEAGGEVIQELRLKDAKKLAKSLGISTKNVDDLLKQLGEKLTEWHRSLKDPIKLVMPADIVGGGLRAAGHSISGGKLRRTLSGGAAGSFKGTFDFVITTDRRLVVGKGHSVLSNGKDVLFAGEMRFDKKGTLIGLTNDSGHYKPLSGVGLTERAKLFLKSLGIDVSKVVIKEA